MYYIEGGPCRETEESWLRTLNWRMDKIFRRFDEINVSDNSDKVLHYNGPDAVDLDFDFARICNNWSSAKTAFQGLEDCFLVHRERPC